MEPQDEIPTGVGGQFVGGDSRGADARDQVADERDQIADERDRDADERDELADSREARVAARERELELRERDLDERSLVDDVCPDERVENSRAEDAPEGLARSAALLHRIEAAQRANKKRVAREQAEIDREVARSRRELDRPS